MKATIFNIQRYCIQDGPGVRTTVFFKGCPLRCVWCHNPESQHVETELMHYRFKCTGCGACLGCEARTIVPRDDGFIDLDRDKCIQCGKCVDACRTKANKICGYEKTTEEIFAEVLKDKMFYKNNGGMTLSGGEPSMQPEAALELLRLAKENGITSVMESCGCGSQEFYEKAFELGCTFYYDIKCFDDEKHKELTGVSNKKILKNLERLFELSANVVLRIPLIPSFNDSGSDLELLGQFLQDNEEKFDHAEIMKYHILGSGKASALGREYKAPDQNATDEQSTRWIDYLKTKCNKIIFS